MAGRELLRPTRAQVRAAEVVTRWYLERHYGTPDDPGVTARFCEPDRVGAFAVEPRELAAGRDGELFRLLMATTMFQRRQDLQILRILRSMPAEAAAEVTNPVGLLHASRACGCPHAATNAGLIERCDLTKDLRTKRGTCGAFPEVACPMKRHTEWLKRYGHFGKVPTSLALVVAEYGAGSLSGLYSLILRSCRSRAERSVRLEAALCAAWRVNQKIASMFLSSVSNPDLAPGLTPWTRGLDWTYFVVVDSNVDLFLSSIRYDGPTSYDARRDFVRALSREIDLRQINRRLRSYNPRIVQQAMYLFMSSTNRRALGLDCMHLGPERCRACPGALRGRCSVRAE